MEENSTCLVLQPILREECIIMKSKKLAEELLKYPNVDVAVRVPISASTYDHPYGEYDMRYIDYIGYISISDGGMVIVLE